MNSNILLVVLIVSFAGSLNGFPQTKKPDPLQAVFSLKLLDALEQQNGGINSVNNLVICPVALENILDVLLLGAEGETAKQIQNALAETSNKKDVKVHDPTDYVQINNLLAVQSQFPIKQSFLDSATAKFSAQLLTENFAQSSHKSTQDLNTWLSGKTRGNISQLFSKDLMKNTKLALLNAVHFVGTWASPIFPEFTVKSPFALANGKIIHVDMMQVLAMYNYAAFDDGELLEIPFRDSGISMLFFLPNVTYLDKSPSFAALFSSVPLEQRIAQLSPIYTFLYLPRFSHIQSSQSGISLKQQLQKLGVVDAFSDSSADFSGIDGQKDLYLGDVLQQVKLQFDEVGARADAGVGTDDDSLGQGGSIFPTPATVTMTFNRTFLYMVHDAAQPSNPLTLFAGVAHNPTL